MNRLPSAAAVVRRVTTDGSSIALYAIWGLSDSNFCGKSDYEDFAPPRGSRHARPALSLRDIKLNVNKLHDIYNCTLQYGFFVK